MIRAFMCPNKSHIPLSSFQTWAHFPTRTSFFEGEAVSLWGRVPRMPQPVCVYDNDPSNSTPKRAMALYPDNCAPGKREYPHTSRTIRHEVWIEEEPQTSSCPSLLKWNIWTRVIVSWPKTNSKQVYYILNHFTEPQMWLEWTYLWLEWTYSLSGEHATYISFLAYDKCKKQSRSH